VKAALLDSVGEVHETVKLKKKSSKASTAAKSSAAKEAKSARVLAGKPKAGRVRSVVDTLPVVAAPVSEESIGRTFAKHDKNRSGTLDRKELKVVLKELGIDTTLSKAQAVLKEFDSDHSGSISLREVTALCRKLAGLPEPRTVDAPPRPALSEAAISRIFTKHDRNKSGFLSRKELQPALRDLHVDVSRKEAADILRDADADGSNTLSLNEFTALCRRIGTIGEPFDRFDVDHCRRWADRRGLQPGGLGLDFVGDYATKGLYAYRGGKYDGMAFFGTGGTEEAMDGPTRLEQYRPHLEEAAAFKRRPASGTNLGTSSARIISSASRADGKHAPAAKVAASLGRSIAGEAAKQVEVIEERPVPRQASGEVVSAAVARSIAKPLKPKGEYDYDAQLQAYQARQLASMTPAGQTRHVVRAKVTATGERAESGCQVDLLLTPLPPLTDVRRAFIKFAPPPPGFPEDHVIRTSFAIFDRDGSGTLSRRELREALRRMGLTVDTMGANALVRVYDDDHSGSLGLVEFRHLVHDMIRSTAADLGHTSLAARHVRAALRELGLDSVGGRQVEAAFHRCDADDSRTLDLGEFVRLVEELAAIKAQQDDEIGSARAEVGEIQALVDQLKELKLQLRTPGMEAGRASGGGLLGDVGHALLSRRQEELRRMQRELRSMLPPPGHGDSVLVCSANEIGTVAAEGGHGRPYSIDLAGGRSAHVAEDDLVLQSDAHKERRWEEVELRTALVRKRARLRGELESARDDHWSGAASSRKAVLAKMAPVRAKLRVKAAQLREDRDRPREQSVQCCSMAIQPYGEVMPPSHLRPPPVAYTLPSATVTGSSVTATSVMAGGVAQQEYKTEERLVRDGSTRVVTYTELTTGMANWQQPKAHGKFKAGVAPTTPAHSLWYKPGKGAGEGSWLGHTGMWPSGDTTFTLSFEVETPGVACFELPYSVDNKLRSATLNGKPLNIGVSKGFKTFGDEMVISAPAGAGLFQRGPNLLMVVIANAGKNASPMGFYAKGRAVVSERVELANGSRPHPLVVRTFERNDTNRSGALSRSELRRVLRDLGLDVGREQAAALLREFDVDSNGTLNLAEFAALATRLGFVPPQESEGPHPAIARAFQRFDVNGTGALSTRELKNALGALSLDLNHAEATSLLRSFDADGSGTLSLDEFAALAYRLGFTPADENCAPQHHPAVVRTFERYDVNHSGALSRREVRAMLGDLGIDVSPSQSAAVLRDFDEDGNGTLNLDEFATLASRLGFAPLQQASSIPPAIARAFQYVDPKGSGSITRDELHSGLRDLGLDVNRADALVVLRDFDADRSGTLNVSEFAALAMRLGFNPQTEAQKQAWSPPAASRAPPQHSYANTSSVHGQGVGYSAQGIQQPAWLVATLAEVSDRKEELAELRAAAPGGGDDLVEERRQALRQAEEWLRDRRAELRAVLPRPRVGDTVEVCAAPSAPSGGGAERGLVTEDAGSLGVTVRMESGKGRRYFEEDILLHDAGTGLQSEQVRAVVWGLPCAGPGDLEHCGCCAVAVHNPSSLLVLCHRCQDCDRWRRNSEKPSHTPPSGCGQRRRRCSAGRRIVSTPSWTMSSSKSPVG
jgi:calcium-binding protein CML